MPLRRAALRLLALTAILALPASVRLAAEEPASDDLQATVFVEEALPELTDADFAPVDKPAKDPNQRIAELEKKLDALIKKSAEKPKADAKDAKAKDAKGTVKTEIKPEDVWTDTSTEKWTIKMGGHVQMDYINWASASPSIVGDQDYFEFRRLRLTADGTGYGVYDFRLQFTLEPETVGESNGAATSPDVKDAYFSINEIPYIGRARIGNFFVPFGLEQVTNDTFGVFLERSIPTQGVFTGDREVGVAIYNQSPDLKWTWASGVFFDSISDTLKERIDDNQGYRSSGRITYCPYYDEPSNGRYVIHTGAGILHTSDQDDLVRFRSRPDIHEGPRLIDTGAISASDYTSGNIEGAVVWGPVTVQSEAYITTVNRLKADQLTLNGAYAHISYFLTGENRLYERFGQHGAQFGRSTPYNNFFLTKGGSGWGGWEAKARWSHLDLNNVTKGQYNDFTVGMNWYLSDRTRAMFDWIHPITTADAVFGATQSNILAMRFDFNW